MILFLMHLVFVSKIRLARLGVLAVAALVGVAIPAQSQLADREFFESRIRPVLVDQCYKCHNSTGTRKAGLALDSRAALRQGGNRGPGLIPGKPAESLLVQAIRHQTDDLRMPDETAKLTDSVIADFVRWIANGATSCMTSWPSSRACYLISCTVGGTAMA